MTVEEARERAGSPGARGRWRLAVKACVTLGLLYLIFTEIPFGKVLPAFRSADPAVFALSCLVAIAGAWVAAVRMKVLTDRQRMSVSSRTHFEIGLAAVFYSFFLPGFLAGGVFRWHRIAGPDRNMAGAAVVVVLNRCIQLTATAAAGVAFYALSWRSRQSPAAGAVLAAALLGLLAVQGILVHGRLSRLLGDWAETRRGIPGWLRRAIGKLVRAFREYRDMPRRDALAIAACAIGEEALGAVSYWLLAASLGIAVPFVHLGWIRAAITVVTTLPVSIGGFGVREGGLILLLAPYGIDGKVAVAFSLLALARALVSGALGGILEAKGAFFRGSPPRSERAPGGKTS